MPLYYFNIHDEDVTEDEEGVEFPDGNAARDFATISARSLIQDGVAAGLIDLSHRIEIFDANHAPLTTVSYADAIQVRN